MKKNPIIPFALIASLGILAMIVLSVVGLNEQDKIAGEGEEENDVVLDDPEAIAESCIGCHGGDLEGASGPSLQQVGSKYSQEEIYEIIMNGIEGTNMPGGLVESEEAEVLSEWLAEKQ
ncbi:cytochrome c550 [Gracilibacillus sp. YIM 98692]|uniref:cytochrome c550 n=1 Tax=Gracilibacillus sp. YIM 98692 TaxID=2663532 RepID=UPI0013D5213A|nr:cytochrome c [Gracilibacillus sp. YIM 98692]